jgi:hypothetical protein
MQHSIPQQISYFIRPEDDLVLILKMEKSHRDIILKTERSHRDIILKTEGEINRAGDDKHSDDGPSYGLTRTPSRTSRGRGRDRLPLANPQLGVGSWGQRFVSTTSHGISVK